MCSQQGLPGRSNTQLQDAAVPPAQGWYASAFVLHEQRMGTRELFRVPGMPGE